MSDAMKTILVYCDECRLEFRAPVQMVAARGPLLCSQGCARATANRIEEEANREQIEDEQREERAAEMPVPADGARCSDEGGPIGAPTRAEIEKREEREAPAPFTAGEWVQARHAPLAIGVTRPTSGSEPEFLTICKLRRRYRLGETTGNADLILAAPKMFKALGAVLDACADSFRDAGAPGSHHTVAICPLCGSDVSECDADECPRIEAQLALPNVEEA